MLNRQEITIVGMLLLEVLELDSPGHAGKVMIAKGELILLNIRDDAQWGVELKTTILNPLVPSVHKSAWITKNSILKLEGIIKKISYEHRDYELVDKKRLS